MPIDNSVVILVPGAFHNPAIAYHDLMERLKELNIRSIPVPLPTVGPKSDQIRKGMLDDVAVIRRVVEEQIEEGKEVIIVCHSYGGFPIAQALEGLGLSDRKALGKVGGVKRLVYVAAFLMPPGVTLHQALGGRDLPWFDGDIVYAKEPEHVFYNDVNPELVPGLVKELSGFSYKAFHEPLTYCANRDIPTSFLMCKNDNAMPYPIQQQLVQMAGLKDEDVFTCDAGHCPFISQPAVVVEILRKAAAA